MRIHSLCLILCPCTFGSDYSLQIFLNIMPQAWQTCLWTVLLIRVGWEASLHSHFHIFQEIIRFKSGLWLGRSRTFTKVTLLKAWLRAWGHCLAESWTVTPVWGHWSALEQVFIQDVSLRSCRCDIPTAWCYLFRYLSANSRLAAMCLLPRSGFCLPRKAWLGDCCRDGCPSWGFSLHKEALERWE